MPGGSHLGEFDLIAKFLAPLAEGRGEARGLLDDAAVLDVPEGMELVITKDMMVSGVHFLPDDPPDLIACKLLRVNLSDLAAMGAVPRSYLLGLALPASVDDAWLERFVAGLAGDQAEFDVGLIGGDTVSTPGPLTLSLTALGMVEAGQAISRGGAAPGDLICVTGTIGDAALGLKVLQGLYDDPTGTLADRYRLPRPRLAGGRAALGEVSAGLDISDGLVADIGHICDVSAVGAVIRADRVPLSDAARSLVGRYPEVLETVLTGGDDYELALTVSPNRSDRFIAMMNEANCPVTVIGEVVSGHGVAIFDRQGVRVPLKSTGFTHR